MQHGCVKAGRDTAALKPGHMLLGGCLLLVSVITSTIALVIDLVIAKLYRFRVSLCDATEGWQRVAVWLASASTALTMTLILTQPSLLS